MIEIVVNGKSQSCAGGQTVGGLLRDLVAPGSRVAVELNGEVLPRAEHSTFRLADGDQLEIVQAIGGG